MGFAVICSSGMQDFLKENSIDIELPAVYKSHGKQIDKKILANEANINGAKTICINRDRICLDLSSQCKPDQIDYKTMIVALHQYGIKRIISISSVASLEKEWVPGSLVLVKDYVDLVSRDITLDDMGADYADMSKPFDTEIRDRLKKSASDLKIQLFDGGVYVVCLQGSRFETPTEINMIKNSISGKLIFGMTITTEAQLAKLLNIGYASIAVVTNYAAGLQESPKKHSTNEGVFRKRLPDILKLIGRSS